MSEKAEITFMQTRLIRLASEEWHLSIDKIIELFKSVDVLGYIETGYGIFHCEGDDAIIQLQISGCIRFIAIIASQYRTFPLGL